MPSASDPDQPQRSRLQRRTVLGGAAATGGLLAAALASRAPAEALVTTAAPQADTLDEREGYRLNDHIRHYYRTARI